MGFTEEFMHVCSWGMGWHTAYNTVHRILYILHAGCTWWVVCLICSTRVSSGSDVRVSPRVTHKEMRDNQRPRIFCFWGTRARVLSAFSKITSILMFYALGKIIILADDANIKLSYCHIQNHDAWPTRVLNACTKATIFFVSYRESKIMPLR